MAMSTFCCFFLCGFQKCSQKCVHTLPSEHTYGDLLPSGEIHHCCTMNRPQTKVVPDHRWDIRSSLSHCFRFVAKIKCREPELRSDRIKKSHLIWNCLDIELKFKLRAAAVTVCDLGLQKCRKWRRVTVHVIGTAKTFGGLGPTDLMLKLKI